MVTYEVRILASARYAPLIVKDQNNWDTIVHVQNVGNTPADVQITYYGTGCSCRAWTDTATLAPLGRAYFFATRRTTTSMWLIFMPSGGSGSPSTRIESPAMSMSSPRSSMKKWLWFDVVVSK